LPFYGQLAKPSFRINRSPKAHGRNGPENLKSLQIAFPNGEQAQPKIEPTIKDAIDVLQ
jgi:hypothetical protein